jgi:phosphate transport system permease protein
MSEAALPTAGPPVRRSAPRGSLIGQVFEGLCFAAATTLLLSLGGIIVSLVIGGWPALSKFGIGFLFSSAWNPVTDVYGAAGPIVGTVITAALALLVSLPIAGGVAFFLTELCPAPLRRPIGTAVELLAGIPSIVYGMWGLFVFAPLFSRFIQLPLMSMAKPGSLLEALTSGVPNGSGILSASIILAIMILPFMAATLRELLRRCARAPMAWARRRPRWCCRSRCPTCAKAPSER